MVDFRTVVIMILIPPYVLAAMAVLCGIFLLNRFRIYGNWFFIGRAFSYFFIAWFYFGYGNGIIISTPERLFYARLTFFQFLLTHLVYFIQELIMDYRNKKNVKR